MIEKQVEKIEMKKITNPKIIALVTLLLAAIIGGALAFEKGIGEPTLGDGSADESGV